jgi:adenylosuccinate synthase
MNMNVEYVDVCCGLAWGDEAKGKVVSYLSKNGNYDFVCRWAGGNNAGHNIYINNKKYKTHLIPSGVFHNIKSIIGPDCVVNVKSFFEELEYLAENGFDTSLIKISPKAHIIEDFHIQEDIAKYAGQGTTSKGIAPCYRDKYGRIGLRAENVK